MTGKSVDNIRKTFPKVVKASKNEITSEHKDSLNNILKLFKSLELDSIVKAIESDLS